MINALNKLVFWTLFTLTIGHSSLSSAQTDTDFWFVVPELSHRGNTGGTPGTLRLSTLELEATVTISMPANPYDAVTNPNGFQDIVLTIPPNAASAVDLSHLIDDAANPNRNLLENKPLTVEGINNFGLHITSTNVINAYWEVNYQYGSDLWTLKGSNGVGTLFYTPFQTLYNNINVLPRAYSAIDMVATEDNTQITIQLPPGKAASYGFNAARTIPAGGSYTTPPLRKGQTFSVYPFRYSPLGADRLAGTRVSATAPIAVSVKDDGLMTPPSGQTVIGDQIVPVSIAGDNYIVPEVQNPNHIYILATEDNTNINVFEADGTLILNTILNEGEQVMVTVPNGSKYARITSRINAGDPFKPIYVWQLVGTGNQNRGGALVPPIGCTGNTQLAFTRAREGENNFYFYIITEKQNMDKFLIDGVRNDNIISPVIGNNGFTELAGSGGWVAQITSSINANVLEEGQHLVENTGGIFHLGIINGFPSAQRGALFYGYYSDFGGLNVGATVAGTNSSVVRACFGEPVQLYAFGGTTYEWTPNTYLDDAYINLPTAYNLPAGPHDYTVEVSGTCGSGEIDLTIVVAQPVKAHFETNVTSGCSPLEITFEDQSTGVYEWQYDLGDGSPLLRYDSITSNDPIGNAWPLPPDPFTFTNTYINTTDQPIDYEITLLVKNSSGCADIVAKTITVFPEIDASFTADPVDGCEPLEVFYTNTSTGDTATWLWDFGDGGSSIVRDPVHEFRNLFGPDNYIYDTRLVAISPYNCRDTATLPITVRPYIEASFAYDTVAECAPHEIVITDQSIGADIYHWDFGDGDTSNSPGPVIFHTYENDNPVPVTYTLSLRVENEEGCTHQIQREVTVYPSVKARFLVNPEEACSPAEFIFQNLSSDSSSANDLTYLWDFGDGGSSTEEHPIHLYDRNMLRHDTVFTVSLVVTSNELCRDTAQFDVVLHPYIEAAFTVEDVVGCDPFPVIINNESIGVDYYLWDFGDNTAQSTSDSSIINHIYLNEDSVTAVYPLTLVVANEEGCRDTLVRNITVHPMITARFSTDGLDGCHPLTITFTDLSVNAVNYLWDFGDGAASVESSPEHTFTNYGSSDTTYMVTLTTSTADGECVKSIEWPITVYPQVSAEFTFPNAQGCGPFEVSFDNLSIGGTSFIWDFGDGSIDTVFDTSSQTHIFINSNFSDSQDFDVSLRVRNDQGCTSEVTKMVTVYPGIDAGFTASDTAGCHPLEINFYNQTSGGETYVWDFGDGSTSNLLDPVHTYSNTGSVDSVYTVKLLSMAPNNICTDSFFMDITVHPYVEANFTIPDHLGCTPFEATFENSSIGGDIFRWDFGDGTDTTTVNTDPVSHLYVNPDFANQLDFEVSLEVENFAGCVHSITRTITVEPDISAGFTASPTEGCHPLSVDFTNLTLGAATYLWDFGNGTTSSETDPSQTFTNIGSTDTTYRVWLIATASNQFCQDSFFVDILVHPYVMADFAFQEQIHCTPSEVQFHNASVGGNIFRWDFGDGTDTITTDMNPVTHIFSNSSYIENGTFQVTLTVENEAGCMDQIVKIVEVYPAILAEFSMNVDEGCHPLEVDFSNLSLGGNTFIWDFGDGASSEADDPLHTFTNFTDDPVTRQVHLLATSQFNCTSEITAEVTIHPKPTARFETASIIDCPPFDLPILNTSLNADNFRWQMGDDTTINTSSTDPFNHIFENYGDDIATYELRLIASTNYGCSDSVQQKVYVYPRTIADFTVNDGDCSPFTAHFINQSIRGETYLWDFGDGTRLSSTDPTNMYFNLSGNDTSYIVSLTATSQYGCVDQKSDTIEVYAQPLAEFIPSPTHQMYPSTEVELMNLTNRGNWAYSWDMGDGSTLDSEEPAPYSYSTWGDYEIWLKVASAHCSDSVSHSIRIIPAVPVADFDTIVGACEPYTVQFRNNSIYGNSYLWEFDDGTSSTEFEPEHTFGEYGIYNVKLTVFGEGGREYAYRQVEVYRMPLVNFTVAPDLVMLPDDEVRLFNLSKYGAYYMWDFGDGNTSTEENPRHLYTQVGTYDISLEVTTENGCVDMLLKPAAVIVEGEGIIMFPNAFKPDMDGPNGGYYSLNEPERNNIFHPYWEGVLEYNLEIYTRWGEKLFSSTDVNIGWDGYYKGELSSQAVYVYKSWGIFINGESFFEKGDVTLIHHRK
ncbi:MAG: PKD domain-containing protein [Bacteroidota bacterium]